MRLPFHEVAWSHVVVVAIAIVVGSAASGCGGFLLGSVGGTVTVTAATAATTFSIAIHLQGGCHPSLQVLD